MNRKLPADAFETYVAMGEVRSYQAVADKYQVSKRCVTARAAQEDWAEQLRSIEAGAREITKQRLQESVADMRERHWKMVRAMAQRAIIAMQTHPIRDGMDGIRAAELTVKLERLLAGDSTEQSQLSIEELHRQEIRMLLEVVPAKGTPQVLAAQVSSDAGAG